MESYYDEIKNDILEALEKEEYRTIIEQAEDKNEVYHELGDIFFAKDSITGVVCGSYYCNSYKARKHCYSFFLDVEEALKMYDYNKELEMFKIFVALVEDGYLNIETMTLNKDLLDEVDEDEKESIFYEFKEIEDLSFEKIDVTTRCYFLSSVLRDVLDNYLE